jgi:hypothetical protein
MVLHHQVPRARPVSAKEWVVMEEVATFPYVPLGVDALSAPVSCSRLGVEERQISRSGGVLGLSVALVKQRRRRVDLRN